MTTEVEHKETDVTVTHKISVDSCIADEINRLNNEHNIFTLSSCCGHGEYAGYIIVTGDDIKKMIKLRYKMTTAKYWDNDIGIGDRIVTCTFRSQSKCNCHKLKT